MCVFCEFVWKSNYPPEQIHRICKEYKPEPYSNDDNDMSSNSLDFIPKVRRYLHERETWKKADKPYRSDEEIERIFTEECAGCEYFNKKGEGVGWCGLCGCRLKVKGKNLNKISWSTTSCADSPPKWMAEVTLEEEKNQEVEVEVAKQLEQEMFQSQAYKQANGLKMKEVTVQNNTQSPKKKGGCGCH